MEEVKKFPRKVVEFPKNKEEARAVLLFFNQRAIVGTPVWEPLEPNDKNSPMVVASLTKAYEIIFTPIPAQDAARNIVVEHRFSGFPLGDVFDIPDQVLITEISSESPYYITYLQLATGIVVGGKE